MLNLLNEKVYSKSLRMIFNFFKKKKIDPYVEKVHEGVDEELSKVKSNNSKSPIENNLVDEKHISLMGWTVACWMLTIEIEIKKNLPLKNVVRFCRLFLEQEKKRNYIKDYNRADVQLLKICSIACDIKNVEKLIKERWTYKKAKDFEKEIGYNDF